MRRRVIGLVAGIFLTFSSTGCSVFMAATGSPEVDWGVLQRGSSRNQIEDQFGRPISFVRRSWGDEATYQFVDGVEPSYWRAAFYGATTVLTGGLGEIITTPYESTAALQGNRQTVVVTYDLNGSVRDFDVVSEESAMRPTGEILGFGASGEPAPEERYAQPIVVERGQFSAERAAESAIE